MKIKQTKLFKFIQPKYHYFLAWLAAVYYRHPSRQLTVIGVTGTKGKSSTVEMINSILETAGYRTAVSSTIRFKIADQSKPNLYKMSMPGRGFIQKFLARAVKTNCEFAVIEITSEGAKLFRNKFINLDAVVMTNISPEHIESHGGYEKYLAAKLSIAHELKNSTKKDKFLVINDDEVEFKKLADLVDQPDDSIHTQSYSLIDAEPFFTTDDGVSFQYKGKEIRSSLKGKFNIYNMLAAATVCDALGVNDKQNISDGLAKLTEIPGRVEKIIVSEQQNFEVVVDYAHTAESLRALYEAYPEHKIIALLGSTGGGRDQWKRKAMGAVADEFANEIFLSNEDPYDEDPNKIIQDVAEGIKTHQPQIIFDRRTAINTALKLAKTMADKGEKVAVLLTGKGTDPYIMEAKGKKTPWNEARVAKEELLKIL